MCHQHYKKPKTESQIQADMWRSMEEEEGWEDEQA
jgi:hypothetical protein